jgi:hypothetical protein
VQEIMAAKNMVYAAMLKLLVPSGAGFEFTVLFPLPMPDSSTITR